MRITKVGHQIQLTVGDSVSATMFASELIAAIAATLGNDDFLSELRDGCQVLAHNLATQESHTGGDLYDPADPYAGALLSDSCGKLMVHAQELIESTPARLKSIQAEGRF